jgi:hypothetical protein
VRARGRQIQRRRRRQTTHYIDHKFGRNLTHRSISLGNSLVRPQQRAHVHDDPERRALAQPRNDFVARAGGSGPSRLAHHAGAHDESHVWLEEVRCVAHAREHTRRVKIMENEK